jgi:hypothetical protein
MIRLAYIDACLWSFPAPVAVALFPCHDHGAVYGSPHSKRYDITVVQKEQSTERPSGEPARLQSLVRVNASTGPAAVHSGPPLDSADVENMEIYMAPSIARELAAKFGQFCRRGSHIMHGRCLAGCCSM